MRIYADRSSTAIRQIVTDLLVFAWVYASIRGAMWLHDLVCELAVPGQKLEDAGTALAGNLAEVGGEVRRVPVVGKDLTGPFDRAAEAARAFSGVGRDQQELVQRLALALAIAVLVFPLGVVLVGWLPLRLRWVRRATAARQLRAAPAGRDLLALRALASLPLRELTRVNPDAAAAWRRGDPETIEALAQRELRRLGLRGSAGS